MTKDDGLPKIWKVNTSPEADRDVASIIRFIFDREGSAVARGILKQFREAKESLRTLPERGRVTPELRRINILTYRELQIKPYRLIYEISEPEGTVFIHVVIDGRRDLVELLVARLLKADCYEGEGFEQ